MAEVKPEGEVKLEDSIEKKLEEMDAEGSIELDREEPEKPEENAGEPEPEAKKFTIDGKEFTEDELRNIINRPAPVPVKEPEEKPNALKEQLKVLREKAEGDDALKGVLDILEPIADNVGEVTKARDELKAQEQLAKDRQVIAELKTQAEKKYGHAMPDLTDPEFKAFIEHQTTASPYDLFEMYKGKTAKIAPRKVLTDQGEDNEGPSNSLLNKQMEIAKKMGLKGRFIKK